MRFLTKLWRGSESKASDRSPTTGRLYHYLAILARPNALQQLFYYNKVPLWLLTSMGPWKASWRCLRLQQWASCCPRANESSGAAHHDDLALWRVGTRVSRKRGADCLRGGVARQALRMRAYVARRGGSNGQGSG